jgi:hypothetical protein
MAALPELVATIVVGAFAVALSVLYFRECGLRQSGK